MAKLITSFDLNTNDMSALTESRSFVVSGEDGATFYIQVFDSSAPTKFYDFKTQTFVTTFSSNNSLKGTISGGTFSKTILFPASASAITYTILLFAEPHFDTELSGMSQSNILYRTTINQVANSTITFTPITTVSAKFASMPSNVTSTASPLRTGTTVKSVNWAVSGATTSENSFGLYETDNDNINNNLVLEDTNWYFTTTDTVDGAISPTDKNSGLIVIVDDVTYLTAGMYVTAVSSGSLSGTPYISKIDIPSKTLTLSAAQTFADGITLTFQARGPEDIAKATGVVFTPQDFTLTATQLTKTIRAGSADANLNVNGTHGISGNEKSAIRGLFINEGNENTVSSVSVESASAGTLVISSAQSDDLAVGGKLYIDGTALHWTLAGTINIESHPTSNTIIYYNLDNILTPGVSSA